MKTSETMKRAEKIFNEDGDSGVEMFINTLSEEEKRELMREAETGIIRMLYAILIDSLLEIGDDEE